jgi:hypothetical protein
VSVSREVERSDIDALYVDSTYSGKAFKFNITENIFKQFLIR